MNSSCTFRHDEEARAKKWEKEKTGDKNVNENVSEVQKKTGEKNVNENVSEVMKDDDSNQAKNDRNHGQGGQGSGVLAKSGQGMQRGTMTTSIDRTGRDASARTSSANSAGSGATPMLHTQGGSQIFNQPLQPGTPSFIQGQAQTPGNFSGQVYHALTPGVLGSNDTRGLSQGVPPPGQAGWGNMSMPTNHEYQWFQIAVNFQEMSRLQLQEVPEPDHRRQFPAGRCHQPGQGLREEGRSQAPASDHVRRDQDDD